MAMNCSTALLLQHPLRKVEKLREAEAVRERILFQLLRYLR
jgi:hypothetical protein